MSYVIARSDHNQNELVAAWRKAGASVQDLHTVGKGCPDTLIGFKGINYLAEIKNGVARLTASECVWHNKWDGQVSIVRTIEEALEMIGAGVYIA